MTKEQLTTAFKALGDPTRLAIFQCLRDCCPTAAFEDDGRIRPADGPTVGEVCCQITGAEKITSTVSAHLKELRLAGLITMEKRGKFVVCALNPTTVAELAAFLGEKTNACC
ncbi:metalloregulator ArsR/SmtB family transcription factor [Armatimonas sp.]|uniref:ArsR/SmtB family transcription factor n=1 Tax=Armatimonas sp. TaxID=1872638 RepID=UPI00286A803F|nr:metalloregulator ArsR/SmtB family transcription factor [Armatimonas sp.]